MNAIRQLRSQTGMTQQRLAVRAGTSQPTIALYESGAKSPTLATMRRLAASLGMELVITFTPQMTREDQRSLAYHRAVAEKLRENPAAVIARAKRALKKIRAQHPGARPLCNRWQDWLKLPLEELLTCMLDPGVLARDMRQVTPFAGVLTPKERRSVLNQFRKGRIP